MKPRTMLARGTIMWLALAGQAASAQHPVAATEAPVANLAAKPALVPDAFAVPRLVDTPGFKLVPLGPELTKVDFAAYMSSIEHLQKTFSRSTRWPREGITDAEAMQDMVNEQARFRARTSFAYAVLTPDGLRERGCVYVYPSTVPGYDAVVTMWVTKAEYNAGFDAELYRWVTGWMQTAWPVAKVAYPGRTIEGAKWDAMTAAHKTPSAAPAPSP
jgi:hypothetical protein